MNKELKGRIFDIYIKKDICMDKYIKNIIEETFASKKQQRFFYAKANDYVVEI